MLFRISIVIKSLATLFRNCGGMEHPSFKSAGTCKTGNKGIIYAWAYDAPGLTLPKGMFYCVRKNWQQFFLLSPLMFYALPMFFKNFHTKYFFDTSLKERRQS